MTFFVNFKIQECFVTVTNKNINILVDKMIAKNVEIQNSTV